MRLLENAENLTHICVACMCVVSLSLGQHWSRMVGEEGQSAERGIRISGGSESTWPFYLGHEDGVGVLGMLVSRGSHSRP